MTSEELELDRQTNRDVAAFSYFLVLSPVLLYTKRRSPYVQFHARQATLLFVLAILFALLPPPFHLVNLLIMAIALTGFIQANMGVSWRIPLISNILESGFSAQTVWDSLVRFFHILKKVFTQSPKKTVQATSKVIAKMRGVDNLYLQKEIQTLQRRIEILEREREIPSSLLQTKSSLDDSPERKKDQ